MPLMLAAALMSAQVAPPTAQEADLRCIAVIVGAIGTRSEDERAAIMPLATYYIGRATGRDPGIDLEAELRRLMTDEAAFAAMVPAETKRCGEEMMGVGQTLQDIGNALQKTPPSAQK